MLTRSLNSVAGALCVFALLTTGCDDKKAEHTSAAKSTAASSAAAKPAHPPTGAHAPNAHSPHKGAAAKAAAGALKWSKPEGWSKVDHPSPMRKGTFKIPKVDGDSEDAEMSITQVGGGVAANIKRWEGQFAEKTPAKTSEQTINGLTVTVVEKSGTFSGMMMPRGSGGGAAKSDWALLGAVVHTQPAHFFKMTGPKKTVEAAKPAFDEFVKSFAPAS